MARNNYQYPLRDKEIITKLSDPNYEVRSYVLPDGALWENGLKYEICRTILTYQQESKISYEKLVQRLGLPFTEVMKILKGRINDFTLRELENHLKKLVDSHQARIVLKSHEQRKLVPQSF